MINKQTAGLLYSYNYKIVDKDGNVWDIEGIAKSMAAQWSELF